MEATELLAKYKVGIGIAVVAVILVLVIYYWGKKSGKTGVKYDLPKDIQKDPTVTDEESLKADSLALRLYNDMDGTTWHHNIDLWEEYMLSTDRVYILTFNVFGLKYGDGESLYQWLKDELPIVIGNIDWSVARSANLKRMEKLGLK